MAIVEYSVYCEACGGYHAGLGETAEDAAWSAVKTRGVCRSRAATPSCLDDEVRAMAEHIERGLNHECK